MNERFSKLITKTVWLALSFFSLRCMISWKSIINDFSLYDIFGYAGEGIGLTALLMTLYEKLLWKYSPFEDTPVLKRYYEGTLVSTFDGIERKASLEIKQTLLSTNIILISGESKSKSISSSIDNILGEYQLTYCYLNTPNASVRERSQIHYGTAIICVDNANRLTGQYFSDRKTTGDMIFIPKKD